MNELYVMGPRNIVVDLYNLDVSGIEIRDIAESLSKIIRLNGRGVSVARHSAIMAQLAMNGELPCLPITPLVCVLHDAVEAYTGDIVKPIKDTSISLPMIDDVLSRKIWETFGVGKASHLQDPVCKRLDHVALAAEYALYIGDWTLAHWSFGFSSLYQWEVDDAMRLLTEETEDDVSLFLNSYHKAKLYLEELSKYGRSKM